MFKKQNPLNAGSFSALASRLVSDSKNGYIYGPLRKRRGFFIFHISISNKINGQNSFLLIEIQTI